MFFGEHQHSLDAKGRLILPAKFRDAFAEVAYVTKVVDGCLAVWTTLEFEAITTEMREKARRGEEERNAVRAWAAGAAEVAPDKQGRIAIPASLRSYAGLENDVMVTGAINHVELWNPERWREIDRTGSDSLRHGGQALADVGF